MKHLSQPNLSALFIFHICLQRWMLDIKIDSPSNCEFPKFLVMGRRKSPHSHWDQRGRVGKCIIGRGKSGGVGSRLFSGGTRQSWDSSVHLKGGMQYVVCDPEPWMERRRQQANAYVSLSVYIVLPLGETRRGMLICDSTVRRISIIMSTLTRSWEHYFIAFMLQFWLARFAEEKQS